MNQGKHSISCLIRREGPQYYDGKSWSADLSAACLYTPMQARAMVAEMNETGAAVICVILNKLFNYYDGTEKFVERLSAAKIFTLEEAEREVARLSR